jgi:hypothetical protein
MLIFIFGYFDGCIFGLLVAYTVRGFLLYEEEKEMKREPFVMPPRKIFEYRLPLMPFAVYCYLLCCYNKKTAATPVGGLSLKPVVSPTALWGGPSNSWRSAASSKSNIILETAANGTTPMSCSH